MNTVINTGIKSVTANEDEENIYIHKQLIQRGVKKSIFKKGKWQSDCNSVNYCF